MDAKPIANAFLNARMCKSAKRDPEPRKRRKARKKDAIAEHLERERRYERVAVVLGWYDPVSYHNHCYTLGVAGDHFSDATCGFMHSFVCSCAEAGVTPTVAAAVRAAVDTDHWDVQAWDIEQALDAVAAPWPAETLEDAVWNLAEIHRRRLRARQCLREAAKLMNAQGGAAV